MAAGNKAHKGQDARKSKLCLQMWDEENRLVVTFKRRIFKKLGLSNCKLGGREKQLQNDVEGWGGQIVNKDVLLQFCSTYHVEYPYTSTYQFLWG